MDKEELIRQINNLPIFELRNVAIKKDNKWINQAHLRAVVEVGTTKAIAIVSDKYELVQFKDVFLPAVEQVDSIRLGVVLNYKGRSEMIVIPENNDIGLSLRNSVDLSTAVLIRFVAIHDGLFIYIPKNVEKIRKIHVKGVKDAIKNYTEILGNVRDTWKTIVEKFSSYILSEKEISDILEELKVGKRIEKQINAIAMLEDVSLWKLLITIVKEISKRRFKDEVKRQEKIEGICNLIYEWAIAMNL